MPAPHFSIASSRIDISESVETVSPEWPLPKTVIATLIVVALIAAAGVMVWQRQVALLLFGGMVLATALEPIVRCVVAWLPRPYAAILVYATLTVALVGLFVLMVPEIVAQGQAIWTKLPGWYEQGRTWLMASHFRTLRSLGGWAPETMPSPWNAGWINMDLGASGASPLEFLGHVGAGLLGVLAVGVLAFYWTVHEDLTIRSLLQLAPEHRRSFYQSLVDELLRKLGGYVRGQLILCGAVGVLSLVAYFLIGLPYALLLALIAAVLEAVPIIGPTLGAVPAIMVAMTLGPQETALVIGAAMLIQTLENYLLVPKVMDRSVGISAVVTLLGIVSCGALFGLVGAIFAIPLAAIGQTLLERFVLQADFKSRDFTGPRDSVGVLHYQLLDLISDLKRQQRQKETAVDPWTTESFAELETLAAALDESIADSEDGVYSRQPLQTAAAR
jgi:predicted PurR-regulated permease PerM